MLEVLHEIHTNTNKLKQKDKNSAGDVNIDGFLSEGRIMIIVRDELAMSQLRDLLVHGADYLMEQRFRWYISQQANDIRKRRKANRY